MTEIVDHFFQKVLRINTASSILIKKHNIIIFRDNLWFC